MSLLLTDPSGSSLHSAPSSDRLGLGGTVAGVHTRSGEHLTLQQALAIVTADATMSVPLLNCLCAQVEGLWRHKVTKFKEANPNVKLPTVVQETRGQRRKVLRVLPVAEAVAVARKLVPTAKKQMLEELNTIMGQLNITDEDEDSDTTEEQ